MGFVGELKPYQQEALDKLLEVETGLLSFGPGLGKTIVTIAWAEELLDQELVRGGLIVVPASLAYQWLRQIETFTDGARALVLEPGVGAEARAPILRRAARAEYLILSYDALLADDVWAALHDTVDVDFIAADELSYIKTPSTKRAKRLKKLQPRWRLGLTGTPLENRLEETYSQLEWIDPKILGRFDYFDRAFIDRNRFGGVEGYRNVGTFNDLINQVSVRKTRFDPDVAPYMPEVVETSPLYVRLDRQSADLYDYIAEALLDDLAEPGHSTFDLASHYGRGDSMSAAEAAYRGRVMSKIVCLKMLCDHPQLLSISAERYDETSDPEWTGLQAGSQFAAALAEEGLLSDSHKWAAPKLEVLVTEVLEHLREPRTKVVIFSYYRDMVRLIEDALADRGVGSVQFHGGMTARAKDAAKEQFSSDPEIKAFLSTDAGGYGVDLPVASRLINYDLPWSAGALEQRNSRIIRLSSEWDEVTVGSILVDASVEEYQYGVLQNKRKLADAFIDGIGHRADGTLAYTASSLTEHLTEHLPIPARRK